MSVKERVKDFIMYKGLSIRQFNLRIGASEGYVNAIRTSIQPDKLNSIAKEFPELNISWLLTGEGNMIKDTTSIPNSTTVEVPTEAWDIIKKQADSLSSKDRQMEELISLLKKANAQTDNNAICANVSGSDLER